MKLIRRIRRIALVIAVVISGMLAFTVQQVTTISAIGNAQGESCEQVLPKVKQQLGGANGCNGLGMGQACYGNFKLVVGYVDEANQAEFSEPGQIAKLDLLKSIQASPFNVERGEWGVAVMKVRGNLPGTISGAPITFIIYGDTQIENAAPPTPTCTGTAGKDASLRLNPKTSVPVSKLIKENTEVTVIGRSEKADWLVVREGENGENEGWIPASAVNVTCQNDVKVDALPVNPPPTSNITRDTPGSLGQFKAFYFSTGVSLKPVCNDLKSTSLPSGGLLIDSPDGRKIAFSANGADIVLGSGVIMRAVPNEQMSIIVMHGTAKVTAMGRTRIAGPFQEITVPLGGENGLIANGPPSPVKSADISDLALPSLCQLVGPQTLNILCLPIKPKPTATPTRIPPTAVPTQVPVIVPTDMIVPGSYVPTDTPLPPPTPVCPPGFQWTGTDCAIP